MKIFLNMNLKFLSVNLIFFNICKGNINKIDINSDGILPKYIFFGIIKETILKKNT